MWWACLRDRRFLARDRELADVRPGEFLAFSSAGAYGFVQASNYNSRRARRRFWWMANPGESSRTRDLGYLIRGETL